MKYTISKIASILCADTDSIKPPNNNVYTRILTVYIVVNVSQESFAIVKICAAMLQSISQRFRQIICVPPALVPPERVDLHDYFAVRRFPMLLRNLVTDNRLGFSEPLSATLSAYLFSPSCPQVKSIDRHPPFRDDAHP